MNLDAFIKNNYTKIIIYLIAIILFLINFPWTDPFGNKFITKLLASVFWFFSVLILAKALFDDDKECIHYAIILALGIGILFNINYFCVYNAPVYAPLYPSLYYNPGYYNTFSISSLIKNFITFVFLIVLPTFLIHMFRIRYGDKIDKILIRLRLKNDNDILNRTPNKNSYINNNFIEEETLFCQYCGFKIDLNTIFCPNCGLKLEYNKTSNNNDELNSDKEENT